MSQDPFAVTRPLVVDLDGTLIPTDLLLESASQFVLSHPLQGFKPLLWALQSRATLKAKLAASTRIDVAALPYNTEVLHWLRVQKQQGRSLVLATASHSVLAHQVAAHLQLFDEVLATQDQVNLKAHAKAQALVARFGEDGFDYVGNDVADFAVWQKAHTAHVVGASAHVLARVRAMDKLGEVFDNNLPTPTHSVFKALRVHQWMKNLLVFVPLFTAHLYGDAQRLVLAALAFLAFSAMASSVYLLNDLVDVQDDRHHVRKRTRPFASGALSLLHGWLAWPVLLVASVSLSAAFLPLEFCATLGIYCVLTLAYSFKLKQVAVLDVLTLAALYTLRIMAGAVAVAVPLSFWLLLFSVFIFLSLALIKRFSELKAARDAGQSGALRGRGYAPEDLEMVSSLGGSAGFIAVLALALYIQDGQAPHLYGAPQLIWLACPALLFWISRAWLIAHRGQMHDDPVVFALKDKVSWGVVVFMASVLVLARVWS